MYKKIISITTICAVIILMAVSIFSREETVVKAGSDKETKEVEESFEIVVEIKGAVVSPGVYNFKSDDRILDAIATSGGLVEDANIDYINQAMMLQDQMLIVIMTNAEIAEAIKNQELIERTASEVTTATSTNEVVGYDDCYTSEGSSTGLISINKATKEQLMTLSGIGEAKASDIISYREANGGFKTLEELMDVNGIGEATFNKIKDSITL